jgi:broad specificity phosphatase PhoE
MTHIYLIRHGQTEWNKEEIFRGTSDIPLNEMGRMEAQLASEALRAIPLKAVYSSPLARAKETAAAIADCHGLEVRIIEGLQDICFGDWQGVSHKTVQQQYSDLYRRWLEEPHAVTFPGGENLEAVQTRAVKAVREIVSDHPEDTIVMVSHRVINRALICGVAGIELSRFWQLGQDTAAINLLTWKKDYFTLTCLNDTCHLQSLEKDRIKIDF